MSFESLWNFLVSHTYVVVFFGAVVDATGTPFPGRLILITAGGIAAMGSANVGVLIALASTAAVLGDHVWYVAGRLGGDRLLRFYCRVAMFGATSCVDKARAYFVRFGPAVFIIGRFVAGVRILITPLAASSGMPYLRYLIYDSSGAAVWATVWILVGYLIGDQWAAWTEKPGVAALGAIFSLGATLTVGLTLAFRWWQRQRQTPTAL